MNKGLSITIGICVVIALLWYLVSTNLFFHDLAVSGASKLDNFFASIKNKANTNECPKEIIPDKLVLLNAQGDVMSQKALDDYFNSGEGVGISDWHKIVTYSWKDGTALSIWSNPNDIFSNAPPDCHKGSQEGENVNYCYTKPLIYSSETKNVDSQGNINGIKTINYHIELALNPLTNEEWVESSNLGQGESFVHIYQNYSVVSAKCTSV